MVRAKTFLMGLTLLMAGWLCGACGRSTENYPEEMPRHTGTDLLTAWQEAQPPQEALYMEGDLVIEGEDQSASLTVQAFFHPDGRMNLLGSKAVVGSIFQTVYDGHQATTYYFREKKLFVHRPDRDIPGFLEGFSQKVLHVLVYGEQKLAAQVEHAYRASVRGPVGPGHLEMSLDPEVARPRKALYVWNHQLLEIDYPPHGWETFDRPFWHPSQIKATTMAGEEIHITLDLLEGDAGDDDSYQFVPPDEDYESRQLD